MESCCQTGLLGPYFLGKLGLSGWGIGFGSVAQVEGYGIITQVALGFIAFVIGNEFRLSALESMGKQAITVGILQAVVTTGLVDAALGMAAEAAELSDGHMVRNVVLFSVLVYELVGPTLTKFSLTAAGEIEPEGRTSARTANKPEAPVTLD